MANHNHKEDHNHNHKDDHQHGHKGEHGHNHHHHHGHSHGHGHGHGHGHAHDHHNMRSGNKQGLMIALIITGGIAVLEFVGGLVTNSLALLSDSGHMLSDASSLILSLLAMWFAGRAATPSKTFGFYRTEILAALVNGATLFIIAAFIIWEAIERFQQPEAVASGTMIWIAVIGLLANLASAWALMRKGNVEDNINMRSAYLHVLGDALGSVGAIVAGILMMLTGWFVFDPIISVFVALLILKGAWGVITQSVHVLMEGAPYGIDQEKVRQELEALPGVIEAHDLHIWSITSGMDSLSCHIVIEEEVDSQHILQQALNLLEEKYGITHATVQIETPSIRHPEMPV